MSLTIPSPALRTWVLVLIALPLGCWGTAAADAAEVEVETAAIPWMTDYAKAQSQAKAEGKHLLLDFTGSDWCHWCHRLESEVLGQRAFLDVMKKYYVFVFVDFPQAEDLKARVVDPARNERLKQDLDVHSYPTLVLTTAEGTPYGRTGYREGGAAAYVDHIRTLRTQAAALLALVRRGPRQATRPELQAGFTAMADQGLLGYPAFRWVLARAKAEDPTGRLGMKSRVEQFEEEESLERVLSAGNGPDWTRLYRLLLVAQHLHGTRYVQAGYRCATWLLETRTQPREARDLARRIGNDPLFREDAEARLALDAFLARCETALAGAPRGG